MKRKLLSISTVVYLAIFSSLHVNAQDDINATFTPAPSFDYNVTANNPSPNDGTDTHQLSGPVTQGGIIMTSYNVGARQESSDGNALYRYFNFSSNYNTTTKANSIEFSSSTDIRQLTLLFRGGGAANAAQPVIYAGADEASAVLLVSGDAGYIAGFPAGAGLAPGRYSSGNFPVGTKYVRVHRTGGQTLRVYRVLANSAAFTLPLDFLSFTAKPDALGKSVNLNWQTTNEVNTKNFEIQRRTDASEFKTIGEVNSKNTSGIHNYSFTDENPASGTVYYRINQVDNDGQSDFSQVVSVDVKSGLSLTVYPNPVEDVLSISHPASSASASLKVLSIEGKSLLKQSVAQNSSATQVNVSGLSAGTYLVVLEGQSEKSTIKFIKK